MLPFQRLLAWQASHEFTLAIYEATDGFPGDERFGLTAKRGIREFRRFLDISIGSLHEFACGLILARNRRYLAGDEGQRLERPEAEPAT